MEYNNIDKLPDDIISHIFSFLTVRDALIARLASPKWLHLPDSRSVLRFDSLSVLGEEIENQDNPAVQNKFVKLVNRFMKIWVGKRLHSLNINFQLGKERDSQINKWISNSINSKVEEIEINVAGTSNEAFYVPCSRIHPHLKRLCLRACLLHLTSSTNCLSNLTALDLSNVPLYKIGWDHILSSGSYLTSLELSHCNLPEYVSIDDGQLPRLKNLTILGDLFGIKLKCPSLEVFECDGSIGSLVFVHVPILREAKLWSPSKTEGCSMLFERVTKQAPHLEALSLMIMTEVKPMLARSSLKELKIRVALVDLLTLTCLLDASPLLVTLHVELATHTSITSTQKSKYNDRYHYNLKEVKIGLLRQKNEMELAMYLLKNAVALEHMVLTISRDVSLIENVNSLKQMHNKINPTAQVIIIHGGSIPL